ncbi:MAG TPA: hypothetical protein VED41_03225 [Solirubrobacteraceae bacterium]|nr:hypothetical protein [Solirubrobacteraceae bacterium]
MTRPRDRSRRQPIASRARSGFTSRIRGGGTDGNEQLTTVTGMILIVLLAVLGVTIPDLRQFISIHLFVGLLLLGPVALKMASTGYRFARYYTGNPEYRRKGPPELILRLIGPLVVLSTIGVFLSGIALLVVGPNHRNPWLLLHKATFVVWLVFMGLHVLGHLPAVGKALGIGRKGDEQLTGAAPGASGRWIAITGAAVAGLVLALLLIPDFSAWTAQGVFHHHHHFQRG